MCSYGNGQCWDNSEAHHLICELLNCRSCILVQWLHIQDMIKWQDGKQFRLEFASQGCNLGIWLHRGQHRSYTDQCQGNKLILPFLCGMLVYSSNKGHYHKLHSFKCPRNKQLSHLSYDNWLDSDHKEHQCNHNNGQCWDNICGYCLLDDVLSCM